MKAIKSTKEVVVNGKKITISKLSLGKVVALLQEVGKLPEEITNMDQDSNEVVANLPILIATMLPQFAGVVAAAVDNQIDKEYLLDCPADEAIDLVEAIVEVNNIAGIIAKIKKIKALTTGKK